MMWNNNTFVVSLANEYISYAVKSEIREVLRNKVSFEVVSVYNTIDSRISCSLSQVIAFVGYPRPIPPDVPS